MDPVPCGTCQGGLPDPKMSISLGGSANILEQTTQPLVAMNSHAANSGECPGVFTCSDCITSLSVRAYIS